MKSELKEWFTLSNVTILLKGGVIDIWHIIIFVKTICWIPFMTAAVLAILITRFSNPLDSLFIKFSEDLSLITFGMFGFMPLLVMVIYDEMDRLYYLYFMVLITLIMIGTVFAYMSVLTQKRRNLSISVGIFLTISMTVIGPSWYWYLQMGANFWPTVIMGLIVYIILLLPVLVGIVRKEKK